MTVEDFCRKIRKERLKQGLTQTELGRRAGIMYNNLCRLERGDVKNGPTLATAIRLLEGLGMDLVIVKKEGRRNDG